MNYHEITAEDGRWARPLLEAKGYKSCEFAFVNIYMWSRVYHSVIARFEVFVIARSEGNRLHYLFPAGTSDLKRAVDAILQDAADYGKTPILFSLTEEDKNWLEVNYPGRFHY